MEFSSRLTLSVVYCPSMLYNPSMLYTTPWVVYNTYICCILPLNVIYYPSVLYTTPLCCILPLWVVYYPSMLYITPQCCILPLYVIYYPSMLYATPLWCILHVPLCVVYYPSELYTAPPCCILPIYVVYYSSWLNTTPRCPYVLHTVPWVAYFPYGLRTSPSLCCILPLCIVYYLSMLYTAHLGYIPTPSMCYILSPVLHTTPLGCTLLSWLQAAPCVVYCSMCCILSLDVVYDPSVLYAAPCCMLPLWVLFSPSGLHTASVLYTTLMGRLSPGLHTALWTAPLCCISPSSLCVAYYPPPHALYTTHYVTYCPLELYVAPPCVYTTPLSCLLTLWVVHYHMFCLLPCVVYFPFWFLFCPSGLYTTPLML